VAQQFGTMPPGRPRTGRVKYAFVRLREETHKSWLEGKRSLAVSSDNVLACWLLRSVSGALDHQSVQLAEVQDLLVLHI